MVGGDAGVARESSSGWVGELRLRFQKRGARTVLAERWHQGPLQVQRPFYPEGPGVCHLYLLHPPGGIVPGDHLTVKARVESGGEVLITTPASTKIYRSHGPESVQGNYFDVEGGGVLEWFPQETIVFNGARIELLTRVDLSEEAAAFTGWEILCLGRPASGEPFVAGQCRQSFEVWRGQRPLWVDRAYYEGGHDLLRETWGPGGDTVVGTLVCVSRDGGLSLALRELCEEASTSTCRVVVTQLSEVIVVRYLGNYAEEAKDIFARLWSLIRAGLRGRAVCEPRIWRT